MAISIITLIEIAGFPDKHVKETMDNVMKKLESEEGIKVTKKKIEKVKKVKELWSTFAELELKFDNIDRLSYFCFEYMPSSIEIIEQETVHVEANALSGVFNDLLAKLHQYYAFIANINAENMLLKQKLGPTSQEKK